MNDLISRQAAIDTVHKVICPYVCILDEDDEEVPMSEQDKMVLSINKDICNALKALPSAEPVRMKGKWIFHETENDRYDDMICPFCKTCYTVDACRIDDIGLTAEDFNFCPKCGADMRR